MADICRFMMTIMPRINLLEQLAEIEPEEPEEYDDAGDTGFTTQAEEF